MWERADGCIPVGKVGLVRGKEVFQCKGGVVRDGRTVLQAAESFSGPSAQARHRGSLDCVTRGAQTQKLGFQVVALGHAVERHGTGLLVIIQYESLWQEQRDEGSSL